MIEWFQQARDRGDPVTGPLLQKKALLLNEKLQLSSEFKASSGWLHRFKERYGIKNYALKGEKLSNEPKGAEDFSQYLKEKIGQETLSLENIYNADESGIYWETLINYTLAQNTEEVSSSKKRKDRFTALFCANAKGNHKIPLLIIGKSAQPRHLKNFITPSLKVQRLKFLQILGVVYTHQTSAWMDRHIFKLWYTEVFILSVTEHQKKLGKSGKVLLILDNAPSHPSLEDLNSVNENFEIVYLPPNVTAIVQPMDQGAISLTKKHYKQNLLKTALLKDEGTLTFLKEMNLQDSLILLNNAWNSLKESTLNKMWKPLLGPLSTAVTNYNKDGTNNLVDIDLVTVPNEICNQISQVLSESDSNSVEQIRERLLQSFESDDADCGWEPLSDDNIVSFVMNGKNQATAVNNFEKEENSVPRPASKQISPSEAFESFRTFKTWILSTPEFLPHHAYFQEFEILLRQHIKAPSTNKVYVQL